MPLQNSLLICGYSLILSAAPGDFSASASWVSISRSLCSLSTQTNPSLGTQGLAVSLAGF
jgi:hypothetical protein